MGVPLKGREEILVVLDAALGKSTARHVLTNTVVDVIDENHAAARSYNTLSTSHETTFEVGDSPIAYEGPNILADMSEKLVRTDEGWRIAWRRAVGVFRHNPQPIPLEIWAKDAGKDTPSS